ncbi:MAG: hypothetical protein ACI9DC_004484, partial [Gammaproteobacteria bacterium]
RRRDVMTRLVRAEGLCERFGAVRDFPTGARGGVGVFFRPIRLRKN